MDDPRSLKQKGWVELILKAQQGSNEAWKELFQIVERVVRHHCIRHKPEFLRPVIGDSDFVQQVALKASQSLRTFRGKKPEELIVWLTKITQNLINDHYRKYQGLRLDRSRMVSLDEVPEIAQKTRCCTGPDIEQQEAIERAREAIARLPKRYQQAIYLRINLFRSFRKIGDRLGCSEDAARMIFHRGTAVIRQKLTEPD